MSNLRLWTVTIVSCAMMSAMSLAAPPASAPASKPSTRAATAPAATPKPAPKPPVSKIDRLKPEQVTHFVIPRLSAPPKIDGVIDANEWREASAVSGIVDQGTDILLPRPTTFYFAWDANHLYFACRTYVKPGYRFVIREGRSDGGAYCYDDGLEMLFKPLGQNVSPQNHQTDFRLFLNVLGFVGDLTRLAVGQQLKNWGPHFVTAARVTAPGTAPEGGSWWELEVSTTTQDFELTGPNRAGDKWLLMAGFNHVPQWMQARIPCVGGYYGSDGKSLCELVENTPGVQMTMDSLSNLANGTAAMSIRAFNPAKEAAKVDLAVDVAGALVRKETLSLPAGGEAKFDLAEKLDANVTEGLVTIRATQGGRTLLTYAANFKVGEYKWMMAKPAPADPNKFAFECRFNPLRGQLLVKADSYYLSDPNAARSLMYKVTSEDGAKTIAQGEITRVAEWYFQDVVAMKNLAPGKYIVEASLKLADGAAIGPMKATVQKLDEAAAFPAWWNKKIGNVERVLPPFTPMLATDNVVTCWGRLYELTALGLPKAVSSQGAGILEGSARVVVVIDGKEQVVPLGKATITEAKDWRVRFKGAADGAGLHLEATGWVEQDGMVYVDLAYSPLGAKSVKVDSMRIEYPISAESARSLLCVGPGANFSSKTTMVLPDKQGRLWSTLDTGRTGCGMKIGSFYPSVWIGSEQRGLLWWADNDQGWVQDDAVPAHEVVRKGAAVTLRNNIIARPVELLGPRTVSFSYMASPFKPHPQGWRMIAATDDGTFFQPFRGVRTNPRTGQKYWTSTVANINWIHPESEDPNEWAALWAQQKAQADKIVHDRRPTDLYGSRTGISYQHMSFQLIGYGVKSMEPLPYQYFGDEWFPAGNDTWNDTYTDYAMYLLDRAFTEGGVVSTYWDLTFPILYDSLLCGLSYRLEDGRVQSGYNGWNCRRFFMRLWAMQQDHGLNPGCTGTHSTNAYLFPVLPWVDAVLDGERDWHLDTTDMDWIDYYPIERMRPMSSPHNWGVGICWMSNYTSQDANKVVSAKISQGEYLWMHDSWINPYLDPAMMVTRMPAALLDWGLNGAGVKYHPYWANPAAASADKDALVSLWEVPSPARPRLVVGVFNYDGKAAKDVEIKLDLNKLGLAGKILALADLQKDWAANMPGALKPTGRPVSMTIADFFAPLGEAAQYDAATGTLRIKGLAAHRGRFVGLGVVDAAEADRAAKALPAWVQGGLPGGAAILGLQSKDTRHVAAGEVAEVTCDNAAVEVSMWQLPDRVMLAVYNTGDKPAASVVLKLDLDKLHLTPQLPWQEFIGIRDLYKTAGAGAITFDFYARTLTITGLPPKGGRLVGIRRF